MKLFFFTFLKLHVSGLRPFEQMTMQPSGYEEEEESDASAAFCLVALITKVTRQYSTAVAVTAG